MLEVPQVVILSLLLSGWAQQVTGGIADGPSLVLLPGGCVRKPVSSHGQVETNKAGQPPWQDSIFSLMSGRAVAKQVTIMRIMFPNSSGHNYSP